MSVDIVVRTAIADDAPALFDAQRDAVLNLCAGAYSPAQMATWFEGRTPAMYDCALQAGQILLAERRSRVLGLCGFAPGEVTLLFVRPEAAGSGLGSRLLDLAIDGARRGHDGPLTVVATRNAQRFYEKHGFTAVEDSYFVRGAAEMRFEVVVMRRAPANDVGAAAPDPSR